MSSIQDDQKVIKEGRDKKLDGVEAPLRDRIDQKLLKQLREDGFGHKIADAIRRHNAERSERLLRRQTYLADWDNFRPAEAEGPYQGTSDLHLPVTFTVVKTYQARMFQAIMSQLPMPKARRPDCIEREPMINELMKYTVKDWANEREGIESAVDSWIMEWCAYGEGTLKARWDAKYERFTDVITVPRIGSKTIVDESGNERQVPVMEEEEREEEIIHNCFSGPYTDFVPEEDLNIIGGDGDPQKADIVGHSEWLTASQLWTLADRKIFDEAAVKRIIKSGEDHKGNSLEGAFKQQQVQNSGNNGPDSTIDHDRYRIVETYCSYDVHGSGINSEVVAWVHLDSGEVVRATFLRRLNKTGKRPFFRAEFIRRPGAPHPIGLVEILYPIAKEMDAIHNITLDAGMFTSIPFGFIRANSSINPEVIKYEPGQLIPVDDPTKDVYFPQLGNKATFGLQQEQGLYTMIERLTGISDLSLGAMSGVQGAARTATGVRGLIGEANANLDIHLKRLFKAWKQYLKYMLGLLQQRVEPGFVFRITGEDGNDYWRIIQSREDLGGDFDFEIDPASADSNPQVRAEKATQVFNLVMNPLLIQMGTVNPRNIFEAAKNLLVANGIKDWSRFISEPMAQPLMLSPREEALRILQGIPVPVHPQGDHEGFVAYFEFLMSQPEMLGSFGQQEVVALAKQAQAHTQMAQALAQAQAQQANLSQQRSNAANAQVQAPTGMPATLGPESQVMQGA